LLVDLKRAAERGAIVIAREILTRDIPARRPTAAAALSFCLAEPAIAVVLIGTTDPCHLAEAIRLCVTPPHGLRNCVSCADTSPFARPRLGPRAKIPTMTAPASGSHETRRWREVDSNFQFRAR
jgi:hypothetical protein